MVLVTAKLLEIRPRTVRWAALSHIIGESGPYASLVGQYRVFQSQGSWMERLQGSLACAICMQFVHRRSIARLISCPYAEI